MFITFISPWLLAGGLLIASPIIIHLLFRRRHRVVKWAAMEFLLDADRRQRHRIRLENLLLLLLRCLAVVLLALIVARPIVKPLGLLGAAMPTTRTERIVILDDSPSMGATAANTTTFARAIDKLGDFIEQLAREHPGDTLTLLTTAAPDQPIVTQAPLGGDRARDIVHDLRALRVSDRAAHLADAAAAVERMLADRDRTLSRAVYLVSDLRKHDFTAEEKTNDASGEPTRGSGGAFGGTISALKSLAGHVGGLRIVDVGSPAAGNLSITDLRLADKRALANVNTRFEVTIANHSDADAHDVRVDFQAGEGLTLHGEIADLPAGQRKVVPFSYRFAQSGSVGVRASLGPDPLAADNRRYLAATVSDGVHTLLVDGDATALDGRGEAFFPRYALAPPGDIASGNLLDIAGAGQFANQPLDRYQTIYICNLYRIRGEQLRRLQRWVADGGGLVIFLGSQVDPAAYNAALYDHGRGLLPMRLQKIEGNPRQQRPGSRWVNLVPSVPDHALMRLFSGSHNPLLKGIKVFRWWASSVDAALLHSGTAKVLATWSDADHSPALVERRFGQGRVIAVTIPGDGSWSNWVGDPSYVATMLQMNRYLAKGTRGDEPLLVGRRIREAVDPGVYDLHVTLRRPDKTVTHLLAQLPGNPPAGAGGLSVPGVTSEPTKQAGLYHVALARRSGGTHEVAVAVNIEAGEGDLRRISPQTLRRSLAGSGIRVTDRAGSLLGGASRHGTELWWLLAGSLVAVLLVEQALAWRMGRGS